MVRILWLYGPPAVGKSVTACAVLNALAELDPATGYVDIDQLGMSSTDDHGDSGDGLKGRALAAVSRVFAASGAHTLVVSGVLAPELMEFYADELEAFD
jgi:adenylylsulfate kinase-like enzyme